MVDNPPTAAMATAATIERLHTSDRAMTCSPNDSNGDTTEGTTIVEVAAEIDQGKPYRAGGGDGSSVRDAGLASPSVTGRWVEEVSPGE